MKGSFGVLITGVLWIAIGLLIADVVVGAAGSPPGEIGSFTGASGLNDIVPIVYYAIVAVGGAGMIGMGAYGVAKRR